MAVGTSQAITEREIKIASILLPLGSGPLTREQAVVASKLLGIHWNHLYPFPRPFFAKPPRAPPPPGNFNVEAVLGVVQVDHTQADAFVVDPWFRRSIGRP